MSEFLFSYGLFFAKVVTGANEILIDEDVRAKAERSLKRMVDFANEHIRPGMKVTGDA